jgi:hypothetical protein
MLMAKKITFRQRMTSLKSLSEAYACMVVVHLDVKWPIDSLVTPLGACIIVGYESMRYIYSNLLLGCVVHTHTINELLASQLVVHSRG